MLIPPVVGYRLKGRLPEGATATDLVLTITEALRKKGVVGKFVEFYGPGLAHLTIADRVTLGNMCPEYGATVAIFPIDDMTLDYLRLTSRDASAGRAGRGLCAARRACSAPTTTPDAEYADTLELDLATVVPSLAGPRRPQDRVALSERQGVVCLGAAGPAEGREEGRRARAAAPRWPTETQLEHGSVVIAAITSCTNTSNPSVMIGAGLVAKKAVEKGLTSKPWVKTSLAPGSKVVTEYLAKAGLQTYLDDLGFNLVGYGCTTCIGNSGPLPDEISAEVRERGLVVASVLSGNRNFEGRIQQDVRANYLASPPLVVAYALAGSMNVDVDDRAARHRQGRQAGLPEGHLADRARGAAGRAERGDLRDVPAAVRQRLRRRRALAAVCRCRPATTSRGKPTRPTSASRRSSRTSRASPTPLVRHHRRPRAGRARRQHHDRPHLAGRIDQGRQPGRQVPDRATASSRRSSTPTARGAATTR